MTREELINDVVLARFFAGEATPEEAIAISNWVDASEKNKEIYSEFESSWMLTKKIKTSPNKYIAWQHLRSAIKKGKPEVRLVPIRANYKIAASILLLISASVAIYFYRASSRTRPKDLAWEVKQTENEVATLSLPEGSAVTVNRNSSIKWAKNMEGDTREVQLMGEAFFDVTHNPEKPFIVTVDDVQVKVLGTAFNVSEISKDSVIAEVIRGKVMMYTSVQQIIIEAGMMGIFDRQAKKLTLMKLANENDMAYATHTLHFESATLKEICDQLARAYGVQFMFENEHVQHCTLTSAYNDKSFAFIMSVIAESLDITYKIEGSTVYISGDGCL